MKKTFCDTCSEEIDIKADQYLTIIIEDKQGQDSYEDEEYHFCSTKCLGKWMILKAKEYGVYDK